MDKKDAKNIQWKKEKPFNKWVGKATCKRIQLDCYLSPFTKINSKQIKDLNIRTDTIKCLEENISIKLMYFDLGEDFIILTSKSRKVKSENK